MKENNTRTKIKFTHLLARFALCALGLYLVVSLVMAQVEIVTRRNALTSVKDQLNMQSIQNDELRRVIDSGSEDDYIERVARDRLGYARQNERVFQDTSGK